MTTQISDVIVPEIFTPYVQQLTAEKTRLIQSGALVPSAVLDNLLSGGGLTFNVPSFRDLESTEENVSTDDIADSINFTQTNFAGADVAGINASLNAIANDSVPNKTGTSQEVAVRLSRNNSWSSSDLTAALAGDDPMESIATRVANYWSRRLQAAFVATVRGVLADNAQAAPTGDDGDYTVDISGGAFVNGTTNFSAEAFLDATLTMGDSMGDLTMVMMHSVVYNRAQKNNLIDFIPDATGQTMIPTFLGREVIVDDSMPRNGNIYETWLFGTGAVQLGQNSPANPTETERLPSAGNGGGQEVLYSRVEWTIHPTGHAYTGSTAAAGGPTNAVLADPASFDRVYPERKQIPLARLITREA